MLQGGLKILTLSCHTRIDDDGLLLLEGSFCFFLFTKN